MANKNHTQSNTPEPKQDSKKNPVVQFLASAWSFLKELTSLIMSLLMLIPRTIKVLIPSVAFTSDQDLKYNKEMVGLLSEMVDKLDLTEPNKAIIQKNWIEQISWSNNRATRERDANELIRWWQIILSVMIPTLAQSTGSLERWLVSIFGVLVAVMTAIYQFRRPEERWRHYRVLNERYLVELWNFISLSGEHYKKRHITYDAEGNPTEGEWMNHNELINTFHERMTALRLEDINKFFNEVVSTNKADVDEMTRKIQELTAQRAPIVTPK